tara:strand:- start:30 stop:257 length:228 start_codon:yes stop_codon:yes gene_type:complete
MESNYKKYVLLGMGKRKVRTIVKKWIIEQSNLALEYGETISIPSYSIVSGFGLPELGEDDDFCFGDLTEFLNNKI